MFAKVIGKKCGNKDCKDADVMVDAGLNLCESCTQELTTVTVRDRRSVLLTVLGLVLALGVLAVGAKLWLVRRASAALSTAASAAISRMSSGAPKAISEFDQVLAEAERRGVPAAEVEKIRQMSQEGRRKWQSIEDGRKVFEDALSLALKDGVMTPEEEAGLNTLRSQLVQKGIEAGWFDTTVRSAKEKAAAAQPLQQKLDQKDAGLVKSNPSADATTPCGLKAVSQPDLNRLLTYLKQGMNYAAQKRYDLALNEFEQVRLIDPNFLAMHENIAAAQLKLGRFSESEKYLQEELKLIGCLDQMNDADLTKFSYMLEVGQKGAGNPIAARAQAMRRRIKQARGAAHYNLACIRSRQGITEQAIAELRDAVANGFCDLSALRRDPDLAKVRSARGFQEVVDAASAKREER